MAKLSPSLQLRIKSLLPGDSIEVFVVLKSKEELKEDFRLKLAYKEGNIYRTKLGTNELVAIANHTEVVFINEAHSPKEELNTGSVDYTLNRITTAHHIYPEIRGDSIFLSFKERAYDTSDIDIKGRQFLTGAEAPLTTVHANVMATIVAGAGNSSPYTMGVAPSAFVSSANFANLFPEPDAFYRDKSISVQNHSYGTLIENFYGAEAMAYDVSAVNNPKLVQVFSAGNSGTLSASSGAYANVSAMANLTGNFKHSKNTIAVAALDSFGLPMIAASRGPAYDGRVKPELAAYGEDGSSGAAALVSGSAALVQDAFKKRAGSLPTSDLVKAVLINSADDVGATGIDFLTGYGSLNTYKAVQTIKQATCFQGNVTQNELRIFPL
ncbi:MAG TPA: S8 family serine peptidase, partial [Flavisolibacter sp.]|nr:S8 family serine peptidase [Flavisolibacter sp.]